MCNRVGIDIARIDGRDIDFGARGRPNTWHMKGEFPNEYHKCVPSIAFIGEAIDDINEIVEHSQASPDTFTVTS